MDGVVKILVGDEEWLVPGDILPDMWQTPYVMTEKDVYNCPSETSPVDDQDIWDQSFLSELEKELGMTHDTGETSRISAIDKGKRKVYEEDVFRDPSGNKEEVWKMEVNHLTRSGRVFRPPINQTPNPQVPNPRVTASNVRQEANPVSRDSIPDEDLVRKQLERTPVAISVWGLICASSTHRKKLAESLAKLDIPQDITPDELVALITPSRRKHSITFTDEDLPVEGTAHNKALHITVKCRGNWVPVVLLDNGSALNVCPLRAAYAMGLTKADFTPSLQGVKAYDNTRRRVEGIVTLKLEMEGFPTNVEFHVIDIPASFNLLLGRPWIHHPDIRAVPSTLHQKVKLAIATGILTICGDSAIRPHAEEGAPLLEIHHGEEDRDFGGFAFDTEGSVMAVRVEDYLISSVAVDLMRKMNYMPGLGLGINQQGTPEFPTIVSNPKRRGLGYTGDSEGTKRTRFVGEKALEQYKGQTESFWDKDKKKIWPGFEIFAADTWSDEEEEKEHLAPKQKPAQADWVHSLDLGLKLLFVEEPQTALDEDAEVMMLGDAPVQAEDPTMLIVKAKGTYKNCIYAPYATCNSNVSESSMESESVESSSESEIEPLGPPRRSLYFEFESVPSTAADIHYEIKAPIFAYFAGLNINCVASSDEGEDFEEEIPKEIRALVEREDERHAQPVKEEVISINLRNEENPRMVQIGSTLTPEETQTLTDLLKEFEDVFAWSHKDMPGIDPEIVEHRIPLLPDAKPVKQKFRRMRPDWALKIKEQVTKQFDAGFLMVTEYSQWVANIVPVPKKDGKIRVCVDFRDLNKASPKDDFPLPHIDTLVDNTARQALLSFMDGFSGYNQILMAPEDREKTTFTTEWGTYCYRVMPFGLKNAGSTYQRAVTTLLHDMIHKEVEVYVDDMIVKSKTETDTSSH